MITTTQHRSSHVMRQPFADSASRRVLFVAPYVPSRIRVRTFHLLRGLVAWGHHVTLFCPVSSSEEAAELEALRPFCAEVVGVPHPRRAVLANYVRAVPTGLPLQAAHNLSPALVTALRHTIASGKYDVLHVEHLRGAELARLARQGLPDAPPAVYDSVDCISLLFERALRANPSLKTRAMTLADLARTRRYEAASLAYFQHVAVTSPEDRWALKLLHQRHASGEHAPITVVPNGVDLDYFRPQATPRDPATILFSGKMSYHANHSAAHFLLSQIMPLVWRERPEARVLIVGSKPAPDLQAFANDSRVTVTGYVPDLRPYMARATLAACPLRYGVGIQNKVLEAMAMATPVITVPQTLVALAAQPGRDLLLAQDAASFAQTIIQLLDDQALQQRLGSNGRAYVEQHHNWQSSVAQLNTCYATASQTKWFVNSISTAI